MSIRFSTQNIAFDLYHQSEIANWLTKQISLRDKQVGTLNYLFCDDEYELQLNRQFLDHDTYTDIITFDRVVADVISGDIVISVDRVGENAISFQTTFQRELLRVIAHGVLHLLGQGDKSDDEAHQMRQLEEDALRLWNEMFPRINIV